MGECFDLTFFAHKTAQEGRFEEKQILDLLGLNKGKNQLHNHKFRFFKDKEVFFEIYQETDFIGYWIAVSDVIFTPRNFKDMLKLILEVVAYCFDKAPTILLSTGIYQLTDYYLQDINCISMFNKKVLSSFPLVFFRPRNPYGFEAVEQYKNVSYVVNVGQNVQNIFAGPLGELMEDESLSLDEAKKRLSLTD